jgi:hypothetical protein
VNRTFEKIISTIPLGTHCSVVFVLAATLYQWNPDRKFKVQALDISYLLRELIYHIYSYYYNVYTKKWKVHKLKSSLFRKHYKCLWKGYGISRIFYFNGMDAINIVMKLWIQWQDIINIAERDTKERDQFIIMFLVKPLYEVCDIRIQEQVGENSTVGCYMNAKKPIHQMCLSIKKKSRILIMSVSENLNFKKICDFLTK